MQTLNVLEGGDLRVVSLADPWDDVVPGVRWGDAAELLTPAFWALRSSLREYALQEVAPRAATLLEEVAFCLLGGFGVTAELAQAFFEHLNLAGAFNPASETSEEAFRSLLADRLWVGSHYSRYRYPGQRARRLSLVCRKLRETRFVTSDPAALRRELLTLEGIGPKTASWIVRNWLQTDEVAIIDIHVIRACQVMGVFPKHVRLPHDYEALEQRFLDFARNLGVPATRLDAVIWSEMRSFPLGVVSRLLT